MEVTVEERVDEEAYVRFIWEPCEGFKLGRVVVRVGDDSIEVPRLCSWVELVKLPAVWPPPKDDKEGKVGRLGRDDDMGKGVKFGVVRF